MSKERNKITAWLEKPDNFKVFGRASQQHLYAVRDALESIPPDVLDDFLKSDYQIVLADKDGFNTLVQKGVLSRKKERTNGFCSYHKVKELGNKPAIIVRSDRPVLKMKRTTRHEIGHAIDKINGWFSGLRSAESKEFQRATELYLLTKKDAEASQIAMPHDRSFRLDHLPLYANRGDKTKYAELAAELFNKYCSQRQENGIQAADEFMHNNYPFVWSAYKDSVVPKIGREIEKAANLRYSPAQEAMLKDKLSSICGRNLQAIGIHSDKSVSIIVPRTFSRDALVIGLGLNNKSQMKRSALPDNKKSQKLTIPAPLIAQIIGPPTQKPRKTTQHGAKSVSAKLRRALSFS